MSGFNRRMVVVLGIVLAMGAMAGCGGQQAAPSGGETAASTQSQDELTVELSQAIRDEPSYQSVTLTEDTNSVFFSVDDQGNVNENESDPITLTAKTVFKFDESDGKMRTSADMETEGLAMRYVTDGDKAVCVTDGPSYSGTPDQFGLTHAGGAKAYIESTIGKLDALVSYASDIAKEQKGDGTTYTLTLDTDMYIKADETMKMLADSGNPVKEAVVTIGFDKDGHMTTVANKLTYGTSSNERTCTLTDFDKTTVEELPKADKTYEDFEKDQQLKLEAAYEDAGK